jgi:broad specificity phosphatase PhoE
VVSSPLERTRQTADALARDHGLAVSVANEVNEIDFGAWTGSTFAAIDRDERWRRYNTARAITAPLRGELMIEAQVRALKALLDLRDRNRGGTVAIVSHGDVIRGLLLYFLGMPVDFVHRLEVAPARISVVDLSEDDVRVVQINGDSVP